MSYMKRDLTRELLQWKDQKERMPLLVRGARQVGKSYIVEEFGKTNFENYVEINFEYQPELKGCFSSLDPHEIINKIRLLTGASIVVGKTLLFFDEIQECPEAITSLRYFYEKLPNQHVIAAGSLLEFIFHNENFRMPVGRIQYLFLKPLSFGEYLSACGFEALREHLKTVSIETHIEEILHQQLLKLLREYLLLGGMPKVVRTFLQTKDVTEAQKIQASILTTYQDDFGKYAGSLDVRYLQTLFTRTPRLVSQRFFYKDVDPELRARELKQALEKLQSAGIVHKSHAVSASGIPLGAQINKKEFKLFFLDVGLVNRSMGFGSQILMEKDVILVNRGEIAEQFVAQELIAYFDPYSPPELYWWSREKPGSSAEIDFVIAHNERIFPIEVKAGKAGKLRSLKIFLNEKGGEIGIRISQNPLTMEEHLFSLPLYLIEHLPRLLNSVIR
jgi:predicted AAA+ superfamily ATPase